MQRSILKIAHLGQQCKAERREETRGSRNKGLSYKVLLRKKERHFLLCGRKNGAKVRGDSGSTNDFGE